MYLSIIYTFLCVMQIHRAAAANEFLVEVNPNLLMNIVGENFLSFNVKPSFIFDGRGKIKRNELECFSKSLSPAYLRIQGPTYEAKLFENPILKRKNTNIKKHAVKTVLQRKDEFTLEQLGLYLDWIQSSNFTPFIILNNNEKNVDGDWNTKLAIQTFSLADTLEVGNSVWQLDDGCQSSSISNYLKDMETFSSLLETFDMVKKDKWLVSAGDLTQCLGEDFKEDLKTLLSSNENVIEAMIMNNESHLEALDELNEEFPDILKNVILYKTVTDDDLSDDLKATVWLKILGAAAVNGYAAVFRDLSSDFYKPSLVYYSSLLYKKLVGRRVLYVSETTPRENVSVFAHCATLPGGPVPGGVTIYATNTNLEKMTVSISLVVDNEESEIMQYVMYLNENGKIMVNENEMKNEDDLQPIIQNVTPFKTLSIELPPNSIGFWVISNTNVKLCSLEEEFLENLFNKLNDDNTLYDDTTEPPNVVRNRRSLDDETNDVTETGSSEENFDSFIADNESFIVSNDSSDANVRDDKMFDNKHFVEPVPINSDKADQFINDDKKIERTKNLYNLFNIFGQLASLIELQEEFLDISSSMFLSPQLDKHEFEELTTEAKEISNLASMIPDTNTRFIRSLDTVNDEEIDLDPASRLGRRAECSACDEMARIAHRERINIILNRLINRSPLVSNLNNVMPIVRNAEPEGLENQSQQSRKVEEVEDHLQPSEDSSSLNLAEQEEVLEAVSESIRISNDEEEMVESSLIDDEDIADSIKISNDDEEMVGSSLTDDEHIADLGKPFIVDPAFQSTDEDQFIEEARKIDHLERAATKRPLLETPGTSMPSLSMFGKAKTSLLPSTLPTIGRLKTTMPVSLFRTTNINGPNLLSPIKHIQNSKSKFSEAPEQSLLQETDGHMDKQKSSNLLPTLRNLDDKSPSLNTMRKISTDASVMESNVSDDVVGLPPPELLAIINRDRLAARLQMHRLKMQELKNRLKLAEFKTKQMIDIDMHRILRRSIDSELKPHKVSKKADDNKKKLKSKGDFKKKTQNANRFEPLDSLYVDDLLKKSNNLDKQKRTKRLISNDIDTDAFDLNEIDITHNSEESKTLKSQKFDTSNFTPMIHKIENDLTDDVTRATGDESFSTLSNEIVKEDPEFSGDCHTIYANDERSTSTDSRLIGIDKNVDLTIDWLDDFTRNFKIFVANMQKKIADSWIIKNLYAYK